MANPLTSTDQDALIRLYEDRLKVYGHSHETVGWGSRDDQELRFDQLFRNLDPTGLSILDVGCGLGDLVSYLNARTGGDFDYVGLDIAPALIASAEALYQGSRREFVAANFLDWNTTKRFDLVVMSGALSFRVQDNLALAQLSLGRMFELATTCVTANFLTSYVDFQLDKNFHYRPEDMFSYGKTLSKNVSLLHDYPLWEFTLQIYRDAPQT